MLLSKDYVNSMCIHTSHMYTHTHSLVKITEITMEKLTSSQISAAFSNNSRCAENCATFIRHLFAELHNNTARTHRVQLASNTAVLHQFSESICNRYIFTLATRKDALIVNSLRLSDASVYLASLKVKTQEQALHHNNKLHSRVHNYK